MYWIQNVLKATRLGEGVFNRKCGRICLNSNWIGTPEPFFGTTESISKCIIYNWTAGILQRPFFLVNSKYIYTNHSYFTSVVNKCRTPLKIDPNKGTLMSTVKATVKRTWRRIRFKASNAAIKINVNYRLSRSPNACRLCPSIPLDIYAHI